MNKCDMEETKQIALKKFVTEFGNAHPSVWKYTFMGLSYSRGMCKHKDWTIYAGNEGYSVSLCLTTLGWSDKNEDKEWAVLAKQIADWNDNNFWAIEHKKTEQWQNERCVKMQKALGLIPNKKLSLIDKIKRFWKEIGE